MTKARARACGFDAGYDAGIYCEVSAQDKREAGCDCAATCDECLTSAAFESEQSARGYSPFEFLAHDMNEDDGRSDSLWEAYDAGVAVGIAKGVKQRLGAK